MELISVREQIEKPFSGVPHLVILGSGASVGNRAQEEIEIINIIPDEDLHEVWDRFIVGSHYRIYKDYRSSILGSWPRRSTEAIYNQFTMSRLSKPNPPPQTDSLSELQGWFADLCRY